MEVQRQFVRWIGRALAADELGTDGATRSWTRFKSSEFKQKSRFDSDISEKSVTKVKSQ